MNKILITGATSGIGESLATQLKEHNTLMLTGRNKEALARFSDAQTKVLDLSKDRRALIKWIEKEEPDIIINNAGFGAYGLFHDLKQETMDEMLEVNVHALSEICQAAIALWVKKGTRGTILNVSSAASLIPFPYNAFYGATKAFVTHLSESLDIEYSDKNIRVLCACPGIVDTNFASRAGGKEQGSSGIWCLDPDSVASDMIKQLKRSQRRRVINWFYRFMLCFSPLAPGGFFKHFFRKDF